MIAIAAPVKQAHIANGFPPEKISIIHNPSISSYTLDNSDKRDQSVCRISYFGTIGNLKGPDRLVELADVLEKRKFPFDMKIYGAPPRRKSFTKSLMMNSYPFSNGRKRPASCTIFHTKVMWRIQNRG